MPLPQHPDAVTFPPGKIKGSASEQHEKIRKVFGPVLGCRKVWTKNQGTFNFSYPNERLDGTIADHASLLFPIGHPRERQERYTWHAAVQDKSGRWTVDESEPLGYAANADGVKFGYLKADAPDADPGLIASVVAPAKSTATTPEK